MVCWFFSKIKVIVHKSEESNCPPSRIVVPKVVEFQKSFQLLSLPFHNQSAPYHNILVTYLCWFFVESGSYNRRVMVRVKNTYLLVLHHPTMVVFLLAHYLPHNLDHDLAHNTFSKDPILIAYIFFSHHDYQKTYRESYLYSLQSFCPIL